MKTKQHQAKIPAGPEGSHGQHHLGVQLASLESFQGFASGQELQDTKQRTEGEGKHGGVQQPEPGRQQGKVSAHRLEQNVQRPGHQYIKHGDGQKANDAKAEQPARGHDVLGRGFGIIGNHQVPKDIKVGEWREDGHQQQPQPSDQCGSSC